MSGLGPAVDRVLVGAVPAAGRGWPLLVGPVWSSRLAALQEYPGRWGRWPGRATVSARVSSSSVTRHGRGLAGVYRIRTSIDPATGGVLVCASWTAAAGASLPACRSCGCTDARACPGGCSWVEVDLCSACAAHRSDAPAPVVAHAPRAVLSAAPAPPAPVAVPAPEDGTAGRPCREVGPPGRPPLVKCGACWRLFADVADRDRHEARHGRTGDVERLPLGPLERLAARRGGG